jgi:hypothetical protein
MTKLPLLIVLASCTELPETAMTEQSVKDLPVPPMLSGGLSGEYLIHGQGIGQDSVVAPQTNAMNGIIGVLRVSGSTAEISYRTRFPLITTEGSRTTTATCRVLPDPAPPFGLLLCSNTTPSAEQWFGAQYTVSADGNKAVMLGEIRANTIREEGEVRYTTLQSLVWMRIELERSAP